MKCITTGNRWVVYGVMVGWQLGGCAKTEWVALFLPQLALPCPASLPASWLHPVLPSQILQLTCSLGWVTWLCLALPCPASLAASWCKALVQEIATSLQLGGNVGGAQWADAPIIASASLLSNNMLRFGEAIWIHGVHRTRLVTVTSLLGIVHQVSGEIIEILSLFWKFNFLFKDRVLVQIGLDT